MIEHTLTHDDVKHLEGAVPPIMGRTRVTTKDDDHKDEHHVRIPMWAWAIMASVMLLVLTSIGGGGSYIFTRVVTNQTEIATIKENFATIRVSMQALSDSNKIVNDQQAQHLTMLTQQYDRLLEKMDAIRSDVLEIKNKPKP